MAREAQLKKNRELSVLGPYWSIFETSPALRSPGEEGLRKERRAYHQCCMPRANFNYVYLFVSESQPPQTYVTEVLHHSRRTVWIATSGKLTQLRQRRYLGSLRSVCTPSFQAVIRFASKGGGGWVFDSDR